MVKKLVAGISFLFSWVGVAFLVGIVMVILFPTKDGKSFVFVGLTTDLRGLPGNILGILAGIHSARVSLRPAKTKK